MALKRRHSLFKAIMFIFKYDQQTHPLLQYRSLCLFPHKTDHETGDSGTPCPESHRRIQGSLGSYSS